MNTVILHTTGCPRCRVLKTKLLRAGVEFTENSDVPKMLELGIKTAPVLSVDGELMDFAAACRWADGRKERT